MSLCVSLDVKEIVVGARGIPIEDIWRHVRPMVGLPHLNSTHPLWKI